MPTPWSSLSSTREFSHPSGCKSHLHPLFTQQSPQWWRADAAVGTCWKSWGMVLKWLRQWNKNLTICVVRDVCVWCICDVWWVLGHSGITPPLMQPMGTYTYGCVAPDKENLNEQCLEQPEGINWMKTINVTQKWSFKQVVLIIRWFL
jgi:hypothetical protein